MRSPLNILLPVKNLSQCKQRLAAVLTPQARQHLVLTLLANNLRTLAAEWPEHPRLVITPDQTVARVAEQLHAQVLREPAAQGLNAAVEAGTRWSLEHGYQAQLVLAPDIAQLNIQELQNLFDHLHRPNTANTATRVLIAAANDGGTNALLTQPPNAIPFQYGSRSATRMHLQSKRCGIASSQFYLPHLALDIDTPSDLACWKQLVENDRHQQLHRNKQSVTRVNEATRQIQSRACVGVNS